MALVVREMNNNDLFERLYNELEDIIREKYKLSDNASAIYFFESKVSGDLSKNFRMLRELRNYIVHDKRLDTINAFSVTDEAIDFLNRTINQLQKPIRAIDCCIPKNQILFAKLNTSIIPLMQEMLDRNISHVPVIDYQGILYGVYSGATLFLSLTEKESSTIDQYTTLEQLKKYLPINQHISERYDFVGRTMPIDEIIDLFKQSSEDGKKLKMIFVTESGNPTEKIIGLITPWNILDSTNISLQ